MSIKNIVLILLILSFRTGFAAPAPNDEIVKIKLGANGIRVKAAEKINAVLNVHVADSWHINSNKPNQDFLIPSKVVIKSKAAELTDVKFPSAKELELDFSDKPVSVFGGDFKVQIVLKTAGNLAAGKYSIPVKFEFQACNDKTCMPPSDVSETLNIEVEGVVVVPAEQAPSDGKTSVSVKQSPEQGAGAEPVQAAPIENHDSSTLSSILEKGGLALSLLVVFLGGLALNLTPCVYPLIPITIGYFGGQSEGRTSKLFLLGILYVLGMAITYSIIGVVTSLSGAVFGTLMQNPYVIVGIALLFIILALSQFGVYEFKLPDSLVAKAGGAKGGAFGAFFMGLTMGIVAAPCIGPFVLGLVTYVAAKGDPLYGFLMFFVMALGLGFPYLLLALFSGKIKKLPRAGFWMEGVKHIFGLLLVGMAVYFIGPLIPKEVNKYMLPVYGILSAAYLLFIDKMANNVKAFRIFKTAFSIIVIVTSVYFLIPSKELAPEWQKFSDAKYQTSMKAGDKMVVDFYADWCIPCKELDGITFSDPKVIAKLKEFTTYKVDMTKTVSDETEILRNKFKIVGMPTILIINSKGVEVERLTGFINAAEFLKLITKID